MSAVSARRVRTQPGPLVAARHAAGLTQGELAARTGLSVRAIRDIERGIVTRPRRHSLDAIVTALDLTGEKPGEINRALSAGWGTQAAAARCFAIHRAGGRG